MHTFSKYIKNRLSDSNLFFYASLSAVIILPYFISKSFGQKIYKFIINTEQRTAFIDEATRLFSDFLTLTIGIIVEALPFVFLGVIFSVLVQVYLPIKKIMKRIPKNSFFRRVIISFFGLFMPVCECGNVPVARSMLIKGFKAEEAMIFLLAAPSINIVTFLATWEAFNFDRRVAIIRVVATLVIANLVAFFVSKRFSVDELLTKKFKATCEESHPKTSKYNQSISIFTRESWTLLRLLVFGAIIAALFQTIIPRDAITAIASNTWLSVLAMLLLAFVISICSSVDAFFALAYVSFFNISSILAFLVAGPMVDIKMIALLKTTFTVKAIIYLSASVLILTYIMSIILSYVL